MLVMNISLNPIEVLLHIILQQHLNQSYCVTVVSDSNLNLNASYVGLTYINAKSLDRFQEQMLSVSEMGCSDYVVEMSNPMKFMKVFEKINHIGHARRPNRKVVFLQKQEDNADSLLNILSANETGLLANILLVIQSKNIGECYEYDLVTHKFNGPDSGVKNPLYLDKWNSCTEKFQENNNLFPHDISNLQGKSLKVACFTYEPYVVLDLDKSVEPLGRDGIEMRIIDEFSRWVNCTVELVRDDEHEWGDIFENGTGNGVLGNTVEDKADLGITALYSWYDSYRVLDFSASCVRTGITCLAPAPRILASWELPILAFSWVMWIIIFFTFFYSAMALFIAQGCKSHLIFYKTFGIMVTQSQKDVGSDWRVRSVIGWLLITGLIIDNAYGGGLAATYTVPRYETSIDTVQDIVDTKTTWGATHDAWTFSLVLSQEPKIKQLVNQFKTYDADVLKQKSFTRSMAFGVEKLMAGYFAIGEYITKEAVLDMELMLEDFYYEYTVIMGRKNSQYIAKVSEFVGRLHESGLMLAWESQVAIKYMDYKVQLEVRLSRSKREADIEPLGFHNVVGIFIVYMVGVIFSFCIFVFEVLSNMRRKRDIDPFSVL